MPLITTYSAKNIFADECEGKKITVTLESGLNLAAGTALGVVTASGLYRAYNDAGSAGENVCRGILVNAANTSSSANGTNAATEVQMVIGNVLLIESALVGMDSNGRADLGARQYAGGLLYIP